MKTPVGVKGVKVTETSSTGKSPLPNSGGDISTKSDIKAHHGNKVVL